MNRSQQSPGTSTFLDHLEAEGGGRFAEAARREGMAKPQVTGTSPSANYPTLPASSPWHADPIGVEPTLGVDVNALDPVGECHEVAQSLRPQCSPATQSGQVAPKASVETPARSFRRRV
jgi:hypothetical protein